MIPGASQGRYTIRDLQSALTCHGTGSVAVNVVTGTPPATPPVEWDRIMQFPCGTDRTLGTSDSGRRERGRAAIENGPSLTPGLTVDR